MFSEEQTDTERRRKALIGHLDRYLCLRVAQSAQVYHGRVEHERGTVRGRRHIRCRVRDRAAAEGDKRCPFLPYKLAVQPCVHVLFRTRANLRYAKEVLMVRATHLDVIRARGNLVEQPASLEVRCRGRRDSVLGRVAEQHLNPRKRAEIVFNPHRKTTRVRRTHAHLQRQRLRLTRTERTRERPGERARRLARWRERLHRHVQHLAGFQVYRPPGRNHMHPRQRGRRGNGQPRRRHASRVFHGKRV